MQHGLSVDDTVDEWIAFMENQQSSEITEDVVYKFESKVHTKCVTLSVWHTAFLYIDIHRWCGYIDCEISFVPGCIHFSVTWQCIVARPSSVFIGYVRILAYCVSIVVLKQLL